MAVQRFGGPWSLVKTEMVEKYLSFFNTALKGKNFERIYIDAFAGSGAFQYVPDGPGYSLFGNEIQRIHEGSAARALRVEPPFDRIIFIEADAANVDALRNLIASAKHPNATIQHGDANEILRDICRQTNWRWRRGVIFLDPFGMSVDWSTLKIIAGTRALDLWFLFALAGTVRNLPRMASALDAGKRAAVTRVLGTEDWFDTFYEMPRWRSISLFDEKPIPAVARRKASVEDIENYVRKRLQTIFPHVEPPKRLYGPRNASLFSLFFAVSNSSGRAITLAHEGASHILKNG
jgi:three-Cys-motif partner protein